MPEPRVPGAHPAVMEAQEVQILTTLRSGARSGSSRAWTQALGSQGSTSTPRGRDRLKAIGDVGLDHPLPAPPCLVNESLESVVCRLARAKPERARQEFRLEDRLEHDPRRGLHNTIPDRRDRQRPPLATGGLRDEHPAGGKRTVRAVPEIRSQLIEQPVNAMPLDIIDGLPGVCRPRRDCGAPAPTRAPERPCDGPSHEARGTVARDRPWPPGRACVAVL